MPQTTYIYHITHVSSLAAIVASRELVAHRTLTTQQAAYVDIAHRGLRARRATTTVPCPPDGVVNDYVPFYFAPRSPMLCSIYHGRVEGYTGGQRPIIHLRSSVQAVTAAGCVFVFTDGHAAIDLTEYYSDLSDLSHIDWPLMSARYWNDTNEDPDRKRRRQAEFLVKDRFPIDLIDFIGVCTSVAEREVRDVLQGSGIKPVVMRKPDWYY